MMILKRERLEDDKYEKDNYETWQFRKGHIWKRSNLEHVKSEKELLNNDSSEKETSGTRWFYKEKLKKDDYENNIWQMTTLNMNNLENKSKPDKD